MSCRINIIEQDECIVVRTHREWIDRASLLTVSGPSEFHIKIWMRARFVIYKNQRGRYYW